MAIVASTGSAPILTVSKAVVLLSHPLASQITTYFDIKNIVELDFSCSTIIIHYNLLLVK